MALAPITTPSQWPRFAMWLASVARDDAREGAGGGMARQGITEADIATFEAFFRRHEAQLTGYLWRMNGDMEAARDLCQETFVRAWQHFAMLQGYTQPAQWLYRVATNLALNQRRRPPLASLDDHDPASSDPSVRFVERDLVRSVLQDLPPKQRALLVLREVQEFSYAELGAMLDMSPDAVKMALSRAREQFRQRYLRKERD